MATWIKFYSDIQKSYALVDLDRIPLFFDSTEVNKPKDIHITFRAGDATLVIFQEKDPKTFDKISAYMRQIEQQIK